MSTLPFRRAHGLHMAGLVLCGLAVGCATATGSRVTLDVPFVPQRPGHCGDAAFAMVLRFYDIAIGDAEAEQAVHLPAVGGTIPDLIAHEARRRQLRAESIVGNPLDIPEWLSRGLPPILYLHTETTNDTRGHFVVVTGLDSRRGLVRMHSGTSRHVWLPHAEILSPWIRGGRRTVLIHPPPPGM